MCLAIPGKIISIENKDGVEKFIIDYGPEKREALKSALNVRVGDYVIISNKVIINKVTEKDAKKFLDLLE